MKFLFGIGIVSLFSFTGQAQDFSNDCNVVLINPGSLYCGKVQVELPQQKLKEAISNSKLRAQLGPRTSLKIVDPSPECVHETKFEARMGYAISGTAAIDLTLPKRKAICAKIYYADFKLDSAGKPVTNAGFQHENSNNIMLKADVGADIQKSLPHSFQIQIQDKI